MWMNKNQPAQNVSFNKFLRMSDPQEGDENAKTENRITCWITFFRPILLKRILAHHWEIFTTSSLEKK